MNRTYIKEQSNNVFIDIPCALCGQFFEPNDTVHSLYQDGNALGDVCLRCVENAKNGNTGRIDRHASRLNEHTWWLDQIKKSLEA